MRPTDLQWRWWTSQCSSWQALPQYQSTRHLEHLLRTISSSCSFQPNTMQLAQDWSGAAGRGAAAAIALHSGNYRFVTRDMLRLNLEVLKNRHTLFCYWANKKASSINK